MTLPIGLGKQGHILAFKPHKEKSDQTLAQPMLEVTREITLPFFSRYPAVHHLMALTPVRDAKLLSEYHNPPLPTPPHPSTVIYFWLHQLKNLLLQTDRARVRTACVRPICSVRPKRPPLRPVRHERPKSPGVLGLHLLRLVPPNTLVPVLTTRCTCHGLIPSEHPPSVSSHPHVSRVDLPDSGSPTA